MIRRMSREEVEKMYPYQGTPESTPFYQPPFRIAPWQPVLYGALMLRINQLQLQCQPKVYRLWGNPEKFAQNSK
jgi:hypothetical protein